MRLIRSPVLFVGSVLVLGAGPATGTEPPPADKPTTVYVLQGQQVVLDVPGKIVRIAVGDPNVADVLLLGPLGTSPTVMINEGEKRAMSAHGAKGIAISDPSIVSATLIRNRVELTGLRPGTTTLTIRRGAKNREATYAVTVTAVDASSNN